MSEEPKQTTFRVTDRRGEPKEEPKKVEPQKTEPKAKGNSSRRESSIDFSNFILSLSTSALMHMGLLEDPEGGKPPKNVLLAKQEIDIIEMLKEKSKGNLTPQEAELLDQVLYELHLRYVEVSR